jgi:hypothetical protein
LVGIGEAIVKPVTIIFNKTLDMSKVPDDWRRANVTPIYKKGSRTKPENYRPVSLTSQICKLFESIVKEAIVEHLEKFRLLFDSQHGFRKGKSCLSNLLTFLEKVTEEVDQGGAVDAIFLDFAKAFDKVPHRRLMAKLRSHGIDGKVVNWIGSWLSGREQMVWLRGVGSGWRVVTSGVPQGSVLGPVLFLIFINDIDKSVVNNILKFADDTKIYGKAVSSETRMKLQGDIDRLMKWSNDWQMQFNIEKCKVMHFGKGNVHQVYSMGGTKLQSVVEEKDLGVWISEDMKVAKHCSYAYSRANRMLGIIYRNIENKTVDIMLRLYKTMVRPHVEYCVSVWSPGYKKEKVLIERIQKRFTRMIPAMKGYDYPSRLRRLGLWTLEERRNRADLILLYKMMNGLAAPAFDQFFEISEEKRTRGHSRKLVKNRCRLDLRKQFFSERVVSTWNGLGEDVVSAGSVNIFKKKLQREVENKMDLLRD